MVGHRFCAILLFSVAAHLAAQTTNRLTFDAYTRPGTEFTVVALHPEESGYHFSSTPNDNGYCTWNSGDSHYRGSAALFPRGCCEGVLSRTNGAPFTFRGFDFAGGETYTSGSVYLTGYRGLQPVVQQSFPVSAGGNFQTFSTTTFTNITELRWTGAFVQIDNVILVKTTDDPARPLIHNFRINSITQCDISGLKVGRAYAFESSTNLLDWITVRTWPAISTIDQQSDFRHNGVRFYRVRELP